MSALPHLSSPSHLVRATITTSQEQLGRLLNAVADFDKGLVRLVVEIVTQRDDAANPVSEFPPFRRERKAAVIDDYDARYLTVEDFSGECG